jgi:hypothetical protein
LTSKWRPKLELARYPCFGSSGEPELATLVVSGRLDCRHLASVRAPRSALEARRCRPRDRKLIRNPPGRRCPGSPFYAVTIWEYLVVEELNGVDEETSPRSDRHEHTWFQWWQLKDDSYDPDASLVLVKNADHVLTVLAAIGADGWELVSSVVLGSIPATGINGTRYNGSLRAWVRHTFKRQLTSASKSAKIRLRSPERVDGLLRTESPAS